ncbi:diguanylate cyclase domain-containing protein [Clostridium chrysemydis]|uniref:diguanylate cyclase domain-containing protein n=1 Tax=Clostridium chrysemydis TaxID=2665504 RepID=UPI00188355B6
MNSLDIRKKVDLSITTLIAFFFALGLSFSILNFKQGYENYTLFLVAMLVTIVSYYTNVTFALLTVLVVDFGYITFKLYQYIIHGIEIDFNTYFWLAFIFIAALVTSILSVNINKLQKEVKDLDIKNKNLVMIDEETNLRNLKSFMNEMPIYISMTKRHKELPLTLMITKLKYSENIKNILGKEEYRKVMKKITAAIEEVLRDEDRKYVLNEDSFAFILITNNEGAKVVKGRIKKRIDEIAISESEVTGRLVKLELQTGFLEWNPEIKNTLEFLERAESQLEYDV